MLRATWLRLFRNQLWALGDQRRTVTSRIRTSYRPRLEMLEDRTVLSPTMVADINQQPVDSNPHNLVSVNGELYFAANDGSHGNQLWKTDGTAEGTVMLPELNLGTAAGFD